MGISCHLWPCFSFVSLCLCVWERNSVLIHALGLQVITLQGETRYGKTLIANDGTSLGVGLPVGIAVDPVRGWVIDTKSHMCSCPHRPYQCPGLRKCPVGISYCRICDIWTMSIQMRKSFSIVLTVKDILNAPHAGILGIKRHASLCNTFWPNRPWRLSRWKILPSCLQYYFKSSVLFKMACRALETRTEHWLNAPMLYCPCVFSISWNPHAFHGCRKLYWSDQGTDSGVPAKIASADMDGSSLKILFTGNMEHLEVVTLDIQEQKLYWAVTSRGVVWVALCFHYPFTTCDSERAG